MSGSSAVAVSPGYSHSSGTNVSTPTTTNVLGTTSVPASPATPIQHRLMLKTQALDTWSLREQLGLASAVLRSGDQNWVSVSRQMKPFAEEGRPNDWFSQKNCALQYKLLLEKVPETPRRKRGAGTDKEYGQKGVADTSTDTPETPGEAIVKRLTNERIQELDQILEKERDEIEKVQKEVDMLDSDNEDLTEEQLDELEAQCEEEDRLEAERLAAHEAWLKDREEKKQAIQAALKAHSAKVPLKGAAALAVQQSGARRASSQSQGESSGTSDVDSPAPPSLTHLATPDTHQTPSSKSPRPESSSPILTSMLNSPSSIQTSISSGEQQLIQVMSAARTATEAQASPVVVIDSPKHSSNTASKELISKEDAGHNADSTLAQKERSSKQEQSEDHTSGNTNLNEFEDGEKDVAKDKDTEMDDDEQSSYEIKKPMTARSHSIHQQEEAEEKIIQPPTRTSRRTKKLSEMSTGEPSIADTGGNDEQEPASFQNTPSSSASSSRASSRETRTHSKTSSHAQKKPEEVTAEDIKMLVPMVPQTDSKRSSRRGGGSRAASRSSSPVGSVGIPDGDETDGSENMDLGRHRTTSRRRRSDRQAQISKSEDFDSAPASPADTASNYSEGTKEHTGKIETDSDVEESGTDSSWRKKTLIFISDFVKRISSKKSEKIFNPDTTAVVHTKESNKSSQRFGYTDIVKQPMSLETLRKRVESGDISNDIELKRDFVLMFLNAALFHSTADTEVSSQAKSIYNDFISYFDDRFPSKSSAKSKRHSSSKRSSSSGGNKNSKTRSSDHGSSSTKSSKGNEKEESEHSRSRKRNSSAIEENLQHQKSSSSSSSNSSKKRRRN